MQSLGQAIDKYNRRRMPTIGSSACVLVASLILAPLMSIGTELNCPWEIKKLKKYSIYLETTIFEIIYTGNNRAEYIFYGFSTAANETVSSLDISQLANMNTYNLQPLPDAKNPRAYSLSEAVEEPVIIYLVMATANVMTLEKMKANIRPIKPKSERGATDNSGPLPPQVFLAYPKNATDNSGPLPSQVFLATDKINFYPPQVLLIYPESDRDTLQVLPVSGYIDSTPGIRYSDFFGSSHIVSAGYAKIITHGQMYAHRRLARAKSEIDVTEKKGWVLEGATDNSGPLPPQVFLAYTKGAKDNSHNSPFDELSVFPIPVSSQTDIKTSDIRICASRIGR